MTAVIAYGTVVRAPCMIGLPYGSEGRSIVFSVVVDEDLCEDNGRTKRRGLYRVIVQGSAVDYALNHLRQGSAVLVKGELFSQYPAMGDPSWNHRVVFSNEVRILAGELDRGRAFPIKHEPMTRARVRA